MKVALVYDRINKFGGAERILLALHDLWPEAPLYTAVYNPKTAKWANVFKIIPSFLQRISLARTNHELFPWLTPLAFELLDFSQYDLVVSVTSSEAKGIITRPETIHLCYCLTPTRYLWSSKSIYYSNPGFGFLNPGARLVYSVLGSSLRRWDQIAAQRPDMMVAISNSVARRIKKYYRRNANIIYPPLDTDKFTPGGKDRGDYFLVVARLVSYKQIEVIIRSFNKLKWPLVVIGKGNQEHFLRSIAKSNITFVSNLTDEQMVGYYRRCRALIFAGIEDFGMVSVEAQACGRPVIAYGYGGYSETIIKDKTGDFFYKQSKDAIIKSLKSFDERKYSVEECRRNAKRFSKTRFKEEFLTLVKNYI